MRSTLKMTLLAAVALAGASAGQARAQEMMHHGGPGQHGYLGFLEGVTLSSEQKTQVHGIIHSAMQSARPQMKQLRALHEQITGELASTASLNPATLAAQQQQAETLRAQLDQLQLSTALDVRKVLTADQLRQAASVQSQLASLHQQEEAVTGRAGTAGQ